MVKAGSAAAVETGLVIVTVVVVVVARRLTVEEAAETEVLPLSTSPEEGVAEVVRVEVVVTTAGGAGVDPEVTNPADAVEVADALLPQEQVSQEQASGTAAVPVVEAAAPGGTDPLPG